MSASQAKADGQRMGHSIVGAFCLIASVMTLPRSVAFGQSPPFSDQSSFIASEVLRTELDILRTATTTEIIQLASMVRSLEARRASTPGDQSVMEQLDLFRGHLTRQCVTLREREATAAKLFNEPPVPPPGLCIHFMEK